MEEEGETRFAVTWIGTTKLPIDRIVETFRKESLEMTSFTYLDIEKLSIYTGKEDSETLEATSEAFLESGDTNQLTLADVSSIEEEDIDRHVLCEDEKKDELAIVMRVDHYSLTVDQREELFADFEEQVQEVPELEVPKQEPRILSCEKSHLTPSPLIETVGYDYDQNCTTPILVEIDQNAARSETVNEWSDNEHNNELVPEVTINTTKADNNNQQGWNLSDEENMNDPVKRRVFQKKPRADFKSDSGVPAVVQAGDIRERQGTVDNDDLDWGGGQQRYGSGERRNRGHKFQSKDRNNMNRNFDRAPGGSDRRSRHNRNFGLNQNTQNTRRNYRTDDDYQTGHRVRQVSSSSGGGGRNDGYGEFPPPRFDNNANYSPRQMMDRRDREFDRYPGNYRRSYDSPQQHHHQQAPPPPPPAAPSRYNEYKNRSGINDHCTRGDMNPHEKMRRDGQYDVRKSKTGAW